MIGDAGAIGAVQRVRVEGLDIAWDSVGDADAEAVLLISGLGTQMIRWTSSFCTGLAARGYRVIRFDNRDAGASTHFSTCAVPDFAELAAALRAGRQPETPYTLAAMASDAIGLLDGLGVARAHIVGRSMGGMIAQILASDYPQRVLSLTSIMSSTGNPALPQATPEVMALMSAPEPDPAHDLDGYLGARLAFARRLAGSGYPFDAQAHRKLLLQELARCRGTGGTADGGCRHGRRSARALGHHRRAHVGRSRQRRSLDPVGLWRGHGARDSQRQVSARAGHGP